MLLPRSSTSPRSRASAGLVLRSAALGVAAGSRSSLGLAAPALLTPRGPGQPRFAAGPVRSVVATLGTVGELVGDKMPAAPSRLEPRALVPRFTAGAGGALALAKREDATRVTPVLAGLAGAAIGSWGGVAWRRWASARWGDRRGALIEDGVALALAAAACLPRRRPRGSYDI